MEPIPRIVDVALTIVTFGVTVYPAPGFVNNISLTESDPLIDDVIATAVAFVPPAGAGSIETVGILV